MGEGEGRFHGYCRFVWGVGVGEGYYERSKGGGTRRQEEEEQERRRENEEMKKEAEKASKITRLRKRMDCGDKNRNGEKGERKGGGKLGEK